MRRSYTRGEEGRMPRDEIHVSTTTHIDIHGTCSGCGSAYARTEDHESERQFVELLLLCDGCLDEWNSIPRHLEMAADTVRPIGSPPSHMTRDEIQQQLEVAARRYLGMSAEEFCERYDGGFWLDPLVVDPVLQVQALRRLLDWLE